LAEILKPQLEGLMKEAVGALFFNCPTTSTLLKGMGKVHAKTTRTQTKNNKNQSPKTYKSMKH
jgi:hypothetical protein